MVFNQKKWRLLISLFYFTFLFNKTNLCHSSNTWSTHQSFLSETVCSLMPPLVPMQILRAYPVHTSLPAVEMKKTSFTASWLCSELGSGGHTLRRILPKPAWLWSRGCSTALAEPPALTLGQSCTQLPFLHGILQWCCKHSKGRSVLVQDGRQHCGDRPGCHGLVIAMLVHL
jgi:hypothetical protein